MDYFNELNEPVRVDSIANGLTLHIEASVIFVCPQIAKRSTIMDFNELKFFCS